MRTSASKDKILVVAAHPDDEVLGCGGTIARLAQNGNPVHIAILGEGISSRQPEQEKQNQVDIKILHSRCRRAAKILKAQDVLLYNLPDNRFDTIPLLNLIKIVEQLIDDIKPLLVFTHHAGDLNIDHALTHRAVLTAARPLAACPVKRIYAFEVPSSTEWSFGQLKPAFQPNVFFDISTTLNAKLEAMQIYASECPPGFHPRTLEALKATAHRWGGITGLEAAEAFELIREIQ